MRADDALKYAAARLVACTDWATDAISGAMCDSDHEVETNAIADAAAEVWTLAGEYGDRNQYSDGRVVKTSQWITEGMSTSHIWHPVPGVEEPRTWSGALSSGDPDVPSPGRFQVTTDPTTQTLTIRVIEIVR